MKTTKYFVFALVLAACGNNSPAPKTPEEQSEALRDSALKVSAGQFSDENLTKSIALLDNALALTPKAKNIYLTKMTLYNKSNNIDGVYSVLQQMDSAKISDAYAKLHLGMEYELRGKQPEAANKYNEATEAFIAVLDTMPADNGLKRNTVIMNMALAAALSDSELNKEKLNKAISEAEKENLAETIATLNGMSREELLLPRRRLVKKQL